MPSPDLILQPVQSVRGSVRLPGSKSLSNRALLLAALADGDTEVANLLDADDTRRMLAALPALGVVVALDADRQVAHVRGRGGPLGDGGNDAAEPLALHLGNAGTAFRPLTAALVAGRGHYLLHGDPRMHERPIGDLVDALRALGARIACTGTEGYPPLHIAADGLRGGRTRVNGNVSSQFLTALLMAAPLADGELTIDVDGELVSRPYIDITLDAMAKFGVTVGNDQYRRFVVEPARYRAPGRFLVEGDASSATYLLAAAAIRGGPVRVHGIGRGSVQGDVRFLDVLARMGAEVAIGDDWVEVRRGPGNALRAIDADLNHITDAAMTVAVLALFADGPSTIRNIGNWRVKETDRLHAMATELRKFGALVEEGADFLAITPPPVLRPARVHTWHDHRIAMSFSLAALGGVAVTIEDPDCVAKTFPDYFAVFAGICTP